VRIRGECRDDFRVDELMENEVCQVYTRSETFPLFLH